MADSSVSTTPAHSKQNSLHSLTQSMSQLHTRNNSAIQYSNTQLPDLNTIPTYDIGHTSLQGVRPSMEDETCIERKFIITNQQQQHTVYSLYAVFDGHGGRSAAEYTRDHLYNYITQYLKSNCTPIQALEKAYLQVDAEFIGVQQQNRADTGPVDYSKMTSTMTQQTILSTSLGLHRDALDNTVDCSGTTAVTILHDHTNNVIYVANVGDSRAVICHSRHAIALTHDHKADRPDEADRIRRAGGFVVHKRVMGELAVSRAIGDMEFKEKGFVFVVAEPEISTRQLHENDEFILLACDGLYDVMSNDAAVQFIHDRLYSQNMSAQDTTLETVNHCINSLNTRDNVTAIVVKLRDTAAPEDSTDSQIDTIQPEYKTEPSTTEHTTPTIQRLQHRTPFHRMTSDSPTDSQTGTTRLSISDASLFEPPE